MGTDGGTDGADGKMICLAFPERSAVFDVFLQQRVVQPAVTQTVGHGEVDAAAPAYIFHQHVVAVF